MDRVPSEILALIIYFVQDCDLETRPTCIARSLDQKNYSDLKSLRLVCRAFCQYASPLLFQKVSVGGEWGFEARLNRLRQLQVLAQSRHALSLRKLVITVPPRRSLNIDTFIAELGSTLPSCLTGFQALQVLQLDLGPISNWIDTDRELPEHLRNELAASFLLAISSTSLPHLRGLDMSLTCTHDFAEMLRLDEQTDLLPSPRPLKAMLSQLRHLSISVSDDSGRDGQRYHPTPYSEAQRKYPNQNHVGDLLQFVEMAESLESLHIKSTHILDLDDLSTLRLHKLRSLGLSRVKISASCFNHLIRKNRRTLSSVWLTLVELQSGNWEEVLLQLLNVDHLDTFQVDSVGYVSDDESAQLLNCLIPKFDGPQEIESYRFRDKCALGDLLRRVNSRRIEAGLEAAYNDSKSLTAPPLEFAISQGF